MAVNNEACGTVNKTIWNKDFIMLLLINIFLFTSFTMLITTIAEFVMQLGGDEAKAGVVAGVFSVSSLLVRPVSGSLSDRLNKKHIYLYSLALIAVSIFGYSIAKSIDLIIFFRLLHGLGWAFATTAGMAMASDTAPEGKISQCIGTYGLANVISMAAAPKIGGFLASTYGYNVMFLASFGLVCCGLVLLLFVKVRPVAPKPQNGDKPKHKFVLENLIAINALTPMLVLTLSGMSYGIINTFIRIHGKTNGIADPEIFFTMYALMLLVIRPLGGQLADKKGEKYIVFPGSVLFIAALVLISYASTQWELMAAGALLGIGYGALLPVMMSLGFKRVEAGQRGLASSTTSIGMDLGVGIGPAIAGSLAGKIGYGATFLIFTIPVVLLMVVFFIDQLKRGEIDIKRWRRSEG